MKQPLAFFTSKKPLSLAQMNSFSYVPKKAQNYLTTWIEKVHNRSTVVSLFFEIKH